MNYKTESERHPVQPEIVLLNQKPEVAMVTVPFSKPSSPNIFISQEVSTKKLGEVGQEVLYHGLKAVDVCLDQIPQSKPAPLFENEQIIGGQVSVKIPGRLLSKWDRAEYWLKSFLYGINVLTPNDFPRGEQEVGQGMTLFNTSSQAKLLLDGLHEAYTTLFSLDVRASGYIVPWSIETFRTNRIFRDSLTCLPRTYKPRVSRI